MNLTLIIIIGTFLVFYAAFTVYFFKKKAVKTAAEIEIEKLSKLIPRVKKVKSSKKTWVVVYSWIEKIPLLRSWMYRIRKGFTLRSLKDTQEVKVNSARMTVYSTILCAVMLVLGIFTLDTIYGRISLFMCTLYALHGINHLFISRVDSSLITDLVEDLNVVKYEYQKTRMLVGSLSYAADNKRGYASAHIRQICDILRSVDPERELLTYYAIAPNRFLKRFAGLCMDIHKHGDTEEESAFMEGIAIIVRECRLDLLNIRKLASRTVGTTLISVSPVFAIEKLRNWSIGNFSMLQPYYDSKWGILSLWVIVLAFPISFYFTEVFKKLNPDKTTTDTEGRTLHRILEKSSLVRKYVNRVAPIKLSDKKTVIKANKIMKMLKSASSSLSIREFYLLRMLYAVGVFLLTLLIFLTSIHYVKSAAITTPIVTVLDGTEEDAVIKGRRLEYEKYMLDYVITNPVSVEQVSALVANDLKTDKKLSLGGYAPVKFATELFNRANIYKNSYFQWYMLLICVLFGASGYYLPYLSLWIREGLRKSEMQFEVDGYYAIILSLMRFPTIMVKQVIEELFRYSVIFKGTLSRCLSDFNYSPHEALAKVSKDSPNKDLARIAERFGVAYELVSMDQAFSDIEDDMTSNLKNREFDYEKLIEKRSYLVTLSSFAPGAVLIVLYILVPLMVVSDQMYSNMNI